MQAIVPSRISLSQKNQLVHSCNHFDFAQVVWILLIAGYVTPQLPAYPGAEPSSIQHLFIRQEGWEDACTVLNVLKVLTLFECTDYNEVIAILLVNGMLPEPPIGLQHVELNRVCYPDDSNQH